MSKQNNILGFASPHANRVVLYNNAEFAGSDGGTNSIIGDFSRVRESHLGHHVRIDRNNLLLNLSMGE